jgi:hypothetical protein
MPTQHWSGSAVTALGGTIRSDLRTLPRLHGTDLSA